MKKIIALILFNFAFFCIAQNLILNPSLEEYSNCPNNASQIQFANNWTAGCITTNTSTDYYHCCMINDPDPFWSQLINIIKARTGCGFSGFFLSLKGGPNLNYREVLTGKLKNKLTHNTCYKVFFNIKFIGYHFFLYNSLNFATNKVSALLSIDSIIFTTNVSNLFQLQPQISYHGAVLNDTTTWLKVDGSFIAQGNEQWMHITSFVPDDSVIVYMLPSLSSQVDTSFMPSYYLIDDVAVYPCDAPVSNAEAGNDTCIKPGNNAKIGTPRHNEYLYWWYNEQGYLLDTSAQITVSPTQTTSYVLVQKDFKFDETRDSVTVTVDAHCYEPYYPDIKIPNVISPNGDGINDKFVIENGKYYNLKLNIYNRWGNQIFESNDYQNSWPTTVVSDGVYFYTLTSTNPKLEIKEYKGSLSVVK